MQTKDITIPYRKADSFYLYCLGDIHAGTIHCVEDHIKRKVEEIKNRKNAYWIGMGDYCMPLQAEILTKDGFKHVSQLKIGEIVLAYDNGKLKWTELQKIYQSPSLPMIELKSKSFYAKCSPNHTWFTRDSHTERHHTDIIKKSTSELKSHHRIIINAPLEDKSKVDIKLSLEEASILGWIVTDGHIRTNPVLNVGISQSKEPFRTYIRTRFSHWFTKEYIQVAHNDYLDKSTFNLKTSKVRSLFRKCKTRPEDIKTELPFIVTRIDERARMAMLEAMVQAEGWMEGNNWHFSQKKGKVLDAFQILATLCGFRLGLPSSNRNDVMQVSFIKQTPVDVNNLKRIELPSEPAWCPSTKYDSWVMRLNGQIAITGNSEFITPKDKRFDPNLKSVSPWVEPDNIAHCQVQWLTRLFRPIGKKCLGLLYGNHENSIRIYNHDNVIKNLCESLGVDNLGFSCFLRLFFRRENSRETHLVKGAFTHGSSGAVTEGAKLMALMRWMKSMEADIYGYGHLHDYIPKSLSRMTLSPQGKIKSAIAIGCTTGSWFRTYTQGIGASYGEQKCYPPTEIGAAMFTLNPSTGFIDVGRSI